jgi:hypothetical protein
LLGFLSLTLLFEWEIPVNTFLNLMISTGLAGIVACIGIWALALTPREREKLSGKIRPWIRKVYPV